MTRACNSKVISQRDRYKRKRESGTRKTDWKERSNKENEKSAQETSFLAQEASTPSLGLDAEDDTHVVCWNELYSANAKNPTFIQEFPTKEAYKMNDMLKEG